VRHYQPFVDPRDEEIKRLKRQLSGARGDLINLAAGDDLDRDRLPRRAVAGAT